MSEVWFPDGEKLSDFLKKSGGTMTGDLTMGSGTLISPVSGSNLRLAPYSGYYVTVEALGIKPYSNNNHYCGVAAERWLAGYFKDIHYNGSLSNDDLYFTEKSCLKCGQNFIDGEDLVLKTISTEGLLATIPIHHKCASDPKVTRKVRVKRFEAIYDFVNGEKIVYYGTATRKATKVLKQVKKKKVLDRYEKQIKWQDIEVFDELTGQTKTIKHSAQKKEVKTLYRKDKDGKITSHQEEIEETIYEELPVYIDVPVAKLDNSGNWRDDKGNILTDVEVLEDVETTIDEIVYEEKEIEI